MALTPFRLPRLHLPGVSPKAIARQEITNNFPLESWERGFSRKAAFDHLGELGVFLPSRPLDPDMPEDITNLTNDDLGKLYGQFVAYTGWLEVELSLVEIDSDEE